MLDELLGELCWRIHCCAILWRSRNKRNAGSWLKSLTTTTPNNTQRHANGHNMEHPTILHPFARGLIMLKNSRVIALVMNGNSSKEKVQEQNNLHICFKSSDVSLRGRDQIFWDLFLHLVNLLKCSFCNFVTSPDFWAPKPRPCKSRVFRPSPRISCG